MSQTFLTENPPMILDATCSYGKVWPKHASIRIDIRPEVHPDIIMDARALQFPNSHFDAIYCDPPFIIQKKPISLAARMRARVRARRLLAKTSFQLYGTWNSRVEWLDFLRKTNVEFHRCLKSTGILYYKIGEHNGSAMTRLSEVLELMNNFVVVEHKETWARKPPNPKKPSKVHWLTMKPK